MSYFVSVVITTYNSSNYISVALNSLVNQRLVELEVLIVDDKSSDINYLKASILKYQKLLNIVLIESFKKGNANVSRNIGIRKAKYDIISFLDADDVLNPLHFKYAIEALKASESNLCFCKVNLLLDGITHNYAQPEYKKNIAGIYI